MENATKDMVQIAVRHIQIFLVSTIVVGTTVSEIRADQHATFESVRNIRK